MCFGLLENKRLGRRKELPSSRCASHDLVSGASVGLIQMLEETPRR